MRLTLRIYMAALLLFAAVVPESWAQVVPSLPHEWTEIVYPAIPPMDQQMRGPSVRVLNDTPQGLRFDLIYSSSQSNRVQLPRDSDIAVRLHRPEGQLVNPAPDEHRGQVCTGNAGDASCDYRYVFPWQNNTLEEAWIECRLPGRTYWVELPYGFTRDPSDPLTPVRALTGRPVLAPGMASMDVNDQILPWVYVNYDLGEIQNRWRASVRIANPFDSEAEIVLYRDDRAIGKSAYLWNLETPRTQFEIVDATGRPVTGLAVGIVLHDDGLRRSDSFKLNRNPGKEERRWGTAIVKVDDRSYPFTVPSSLFEYVHGAVGTYPRPSIPRKAP